MTMPTSPLFHWALMESPLGVGGVIVGEGGVVRRVLLPCANAEEARAGIESALRRLILSPRHAAGRPEERPDTAEEAVNLAAFARQDGAWVRNPKRQIQEFLEGRRQTFDLPIDLEGIPGFTRDALLAAAQIPYGQTRSYWWVAVRAGNPRAVRAVGQAMATNPLPLIVPCHRVVRSDGSLGGFGGGGPEQKRQLIELEMRVAGVAVPA